MNCDRMNVEATGVGSTRRAWDVLSFLLCFVFLGSVCISAWGQVGAGSLSGIVQDTTGAIIPGATVTIQNTASGAQRHLQSNSAGAFTFSAIPSGDYKVTVEHAGFKQLVRASVHLNAGGQPGADRPATHRGRRESERDREHDGGEFAVGQWATELHDLRE